MAMLNKDKQAAFKEKMRERDMVQVTEWIPRKKYEEFKKAVVSVKKTKGRSQDKEQISLWFPVGTKDRLKALAPEFGTMTDTVLRAISALEAQQEREHDECEEVSDEELVSKLAFIIKAAKGAGINL